MQFSAYVIYMLSPLGNAYLMLAFHQAGYVAGLLLGVGICPKPLDEILLYAICTKVGTALIGGEPGSLLLTWINLNPSMDK